MGTTLLGPPVRTYFTIGYDLSNRKAWSMLMYQNAKEVDFVMILWLSKFNISCVMRYCSDRRQGFDGAIRLTDITNHSCLFCTLTFSVLDSLKLNPSPSINSTILPVTLSVSVRCLSQLPHTGIFPNYDGLDDYGVLA